LVRNIAVVGAGQWGKNLIRNFFELGALKVICDVRQNLKEVYQNQYPRINFTNSFSNLLSNSSIKGIVIATPAETHFDLAKEALLAGKDVFVEKPLASRLEEGEELVELSEKTKRILMIGHILRYHPAVNKLKELIDEGELGKIQYIYSNRLNIGRIRNEENILWSFAPHDTSVILFLLKELPEVVFSTGGSYLQQKIFDVTLTSMDFAGGVKAHIFVSWLHPFKEQKLVIVGSEKMAVFDDVRKEKLFLYPHKIKWVGRLPVAHKAQAELIPFQMEEPLKLECQHFLDCIENRFTPRTDAREGLRVLRVLQASQESLERGKRVYLKEQGPAKIKDFYIHPTSIIDDGCQIGKGTRIWHFSHILKGSKIGENCRIGQNVVIGPDVTIGDRVKIQNNVSVHKGLTLEDEVFCGPSVVFTNVTNPRSAIPRMSELKTTLVKKGSTIGANATIICGNTIGKYAFIGAAAVVTKNVLDYALVYGNPARIRNWMCECGMKLGFTSNSTKCKVCGKEYFKKKEKVCRKTKDESSNSRPQKTS